MHDFPERIAALQPFWNSWYLEDTLGNGRFGRVYRIYREEFGQRYLSAMKWITLPLEQSEISSMRSSGMSDENIRAYYADHVQDFLSEITLMSTLRGSSHIVSFEDHACLERSGEIGWDILIRMELLTPLSQKITQGMTVGDVVQMGIDLCDALILCEKKKIVHRDIKPENIFINSVGDYKLGDFGVARQMQHELTNLSTRGTPIYMAPELYRGEASDQSVDQYSLGLVMHRLLNAQQIPFAATYDRILTHSEREEAFMLRLKGAPIQPPLQGSRKLQEIICRACSYKPKKRFASPEAMRAALESVLHDKECAAPIIASGAGPKMNSDRSTLTLNQIPRPKAKWPYIVAAGVGLLGVASTAAYLIMHQAEKDPQTPPTPTFAQVATGELASTASAGFADATAERTTPEPSATETFTPQVTATPVPTDSPTDTPVPTDSPTATPTPTPTPTLEPTPEPTPTVWPYTSADAFQTAPDGSGGLMITHYTGSDKVVDIPPSIDGQNITAIGAEAFMNNSEITSVKVPQGMILLGNSAFEGCTQLRSVSLPDSMLSVGNKAFYRCTNLTDVTLPSNVSMLGDHAFAECGSLERIVIPEGVSSISSHCFDACASLKEVILPQGITSIGECSFQNCASLNGIRLPEGLASIGNNAFIGCEHMTSIMIPDHVSWIGEAAFANCTSLASIKLPNELTTISNALFSGCTSLTNASVPSGVSAIGDLAFWGCGSLSSVTLPEGLTAIGASVFVGCDRLTSIVIPDRVTWIGEAAFASCANLNSVKLPSGLTSISNALFSSCAALTNVNIPSGVITIGDTAFWGCSNLRTVTIPEGATTIGADAFTGCEKLSGVILPQSLTTIQERAFAYCTGLTDLTLSEHVLSIADTAFSGCDNLTLHVPQASYAEQYAAARGLLPATPTPSPSPTPSPTPSPSPTPTESIDSLSIQYQLGNYINAYFRQSQRLEVYTGPGYNYLRGANGKAVVSTNDWIHCYGSYNGWYLIEYEINNKTHRRGFVSKSSIQGSYTMNDEALPWANRTVTLTGNATVTDDPYYSGQSLCTLKKDDQATLLFFDGSWAAIEVNSASVGLVQGYVPRSSLALVN